MRKKVIAGNWKMNKTPSEATNYINDFAKTMGNAKDEIVICAPYIDLPVLTNLTKFINVKIGAQNMHFEDKGAYTGEISGNMLKEIDAEYVIIGHSERRSYYNETDESINKKLRKAFECDLKPILCVGETLDQREKGIAREVIVNQIKLDLEGLTNDNVKDTIIAYEPIWAIGTGKTASKEEANEAISWLREEIKSLYGNEISECVIILYGGSIKSSNAKELFEMPDIDGGLIGGSSLEVEEFSKIINWRN